MSVYAVESPFGTGTSGRFALSVFPGRTSAGRWVEGDPVRREPASLRDVEGIVGPRCAWVAVFGDAPVSESLGSFDRELDSWTDRSTGLPVVRYGRS